MTGNNMIDHYQSDFDQLIEKLANEKVLSSDHKEFRRQSFQAFKAAGFPTTKLEEWRFTNVSPIAEEKFQVSAQPAVRISEKEIENYYFDSWAGAQLVFIDGKYQPELSQFPTDSEDFDISSLQNLMSERKSEPVNILKGQNTENAFSALNSALFTDGVNIRVTNNSVIKNPVHVIFVSSGQKKPQAIFPRNQISLGKNSQLHLVETYVSLENSKYFTNAFMNIEVGENAELNHIKIQTESTRAFHISNTYVYQKSNSRYKNTAVSFGSRLSRNNINTILDGEGIESVLNGLYMAHQDQHMDTHTLLDHAKPHCNSHELYRGILADQAKGVFSGKILVRQEAQKTDAVQSNNCILLSEDARIDAKPQLEIYADDVKCTHGATVGQLDENALFYLRSRGIGATKAKNILIYAFAEEVIEEIEIEPVRQRIDQFILDRFSDDMAFSM